MKKSIIAAGAASVALAALPMAGVFAETTSFTDQAVVKVERGCTFVVTDNTTPTPNVIGLTNPRVFQKTVTLGEFVILGGTGGNETTGAASAQNIAVSCSADAENEESWSISAKGGHFVDEAFTSSTVMTGASGGTSIGTAGGAPTTGATSSWAFRVDTTANSNYKAADTWYAVPAAGTGTEGADVVVASGTPSATGTVSFAPSYRVYVGTNQEADTYTGYVTYTLSDTLSNN